MAQRFCASPYSGSWAEPLDELFAFQWTRKSASRSVAAGAVGDVLGDTLRHAEELLDVADEEFGNRSSESASGDNRRRALVEDKAPRAYATRQADGIGCKEPLALACF